MEAEIAVEDQHRQRRGQDRKRGDDQEIGGQRGPAEHRHAQIRHALGADLQHRGDEVDARDQCADPGNLQRPQIIVDADPGRIGQFRQRRIRQPAGAGELADHKRYVDQQSAGGGQPEADRIERRKRHVADAELQRHHQIHQTDHERHRDKEDHDGAVRGEYLIVMLRRQEARRMKRNGLLRPHHQRVGKAAQQHHHREQRVHHADPLVINAGDPFIPKIRQMALDDDPDQHGEDPDQHHRTREQRDRLIEWDRGPGQLTEHRWLRSSPSVQAPAPAGCAGSRCPGTVRGPRADRPSCPGAPIALPVPGSCRRSAPGRCGRI